MDVIRLQFSGKLYIFKLHEAEMKHFKTLIVDSVDILFVESDSFEGACCRNERPSVRVVVFKSKGW